MSRRRSSRKRTPFLDSVYSNELIGKMINYIMCDGKKAKAEFIVYGAFKMLSTYTGISVIEAFKIMVSNVRPVVEVKSRRIGGSTYQIPVEIKYERSIVLAIRWLINSARKRRDKISITTRLSYEFIDAFRGRGLTFKKKEDTHKMAEANKAFSHYRW